MEEYKDYQNLPSKRLVLTLINNNTVSIDLQNNMIMI